MLAFLTGRTAASIAIVDAVMYIVFQHNNYHAAPVAILAKLYTNALMVLFNSRRRHESIHSTVNYTWDGEGGPPSNRPGIPSDSVFNRAISVDVNVNRTTDAPIESYSMAPFSVSFALRKDFRTSCTSSSPRNMLMKGLVPRKESRKPDGTWTNECVPVAVMLLSIKLSAILCIIVQLFDPDLHL